MSSVAARVARTIRERDLMGPADRIAVALSGGADSVALLFLLCEVASLLACRIAGVIHVNHGLRGDEAARDEAFCRALAQRLKLPADIGAVDTRAFAHAQHVSIETAARSLREQFLSEAAVRLDATFVATGHTADDQAETVLLRLLRGAGGRGVSGIRARRGIFVRPLIDCRRADIRAFLAERGEPHCEDSSNASTDFARNRVRHELLPVIERIAPGGVPALARFASLAADDERFLEEAAIVAASTIVLINSGGVQVSRGALNALAPAVARRVVRLALERAGASRIGAAHIEAIRALAASKEEEGHLDLAGMAVERRGELVRFGVTPLSESTRFERALLVPGSVDVPEAGIIVAAEERPSAQGMVLVNDHASDVVVQAAAIRLPLSVRNRRPGDRFRPLGAPGRRKLQDVLIDRKMPREEPRSSSDCGGCVRTDCMGRWRDNCP